MDNIVEIYKAQILIEQEKLLEISGKIAPLEQEKTRTERNIKALEQLIGSNEETIQVINEEIQLPKGSLSTKTPMEAYKELGRDYFQGKSFKDPDLREIATKEGLEVNGKPISPSYSRQTIGKLLGNGTFKKVKKGVYRFRQQKEESRVLGFGISREPV